MTLRAWDSVECNNYTSTRHAYIYKHITNFRNTVFSSYLADRRFQKRTAVLVAMCRDPVSQGCCNVCPHNKQRKGTLQAALSLPEELTRVLSWRAPGYYAGPGMNIQAFWWIGRFCNKQVIALHYSADFRVVLCSGIGTKTDASRYNKDQQQGHKWNWNTVNPYDQLEARRNACNTWQSTSVSIQGPTGDVDFLPRERSRQE